MDGYFYEQPKKQLHHLRIVSGAVLLVKCATFGVKVAWLNICVILLLFLYYTNIPVLITSS